MNAAEFLRAAADHIDRVGLNQDGGMFQDFKVHSYDDPVADTTPCCIMGALSLMRHRAQAEHGTYQLAAQMLYVDPRVNEWGSVAAWNDQPTTTKADAVDLLRVSADRAEAFAAAQTA